MTTPQFQLPKAVLFDYDGVLVASEPIHLSAWMQLLDELGLPLDQEVISDSVGRIAPKILARLLDKHRPGWSASDYDVHALAQRKNDFYVSTAQTQLRLYPGVRDGIEWLIARQIQVAVVSNARRRELDKTMKMLGLFDLLSTVISRDDAPAAKPDPAPYLLAASFLGVEVQDCLAIEDSPTGLEAALFARVPVAAVTTNFSEKALAMPVPGRPDLKPIWIGPSLLNFFKWLASFED